MQLTKTQKIITSIIILVVLLGIYIAFDRKSKGEQKQFENLSQDKFSTTTASGVEITSNAGGYKIEQVPVDEGRIPEPIPDLTRKAVFGNPSLSPEVKELINQKIANLQSEISKNLSYYDAWIDLGLYYKMAGDYEGAKIAWVYAGKLAPNNFVSFGNLGNLYAYYLKDNGMAETYYKQAISKGPTQAYLYIQLAEVYRDIFKDLSKAKAIIDQGLSKIPNDPSLLQFKSNL